MLAKHPEAFANHAARFWLGPGADPAKALALAQVNLQGRKTADAYELALEAALDALDHAPLCALAKEAEPHAKASVPLTVALERADEACGARKRPRSRSGCALRCSEPGAELAQREPSSSA